MTFIKHKILFLKFTGRWFPPSIKRKRKKNKKKGKEKERKEDHVATSFITAHAQEKNPGLASLSHLR